MKYLNYFFAMFLMSQAFANEALKTTAEKSNWDRTGDAKEIRNLCFEFQKVQALAAKCSIYGNTPENRDLYYLTVGDTTTPAIWVQAGIHAGEIDGKDAVFLLLKDIAEGKIENPLQGIHLVFIPAVNLDGHERRGRWNRPNQVGPEEMGWRVTSQNLNMNRDFMKLDASETRDLLKLWHEIDPILSLDLHATNGAQFQPEVGLIILPNIYHESGPLHQAGSDFEVALLEKMKQKKHLPLSFYPTFEEYENPLSGVAREVSLPRFANGYWYRNNRLGMLVETHSWKDYATRVRTHYDTVLSSLEIAKEKARTWKKKAKELDLANYSGKKVELEFEHTKKFSMIDFAGYKFTREKSEISGELVTKYFPESPEVWKIPFYEELKSSLTVRAPKIGYYLQPSDVEWILPKLEVHGIKYEKMKNNPGHLEVFRATKTQFAPKSYEGHQTLTLEGEWKNEKVKLPKAMIFVPLHQPKAKLILQLFEPRSQDSFLFWGFFNRAFERKEYMEDYVAEEVATEMLKNPVIKKEFEKKLKSDPAFAKDPDLRFEFFYRKHPSWDDHFNRYPVFRR